MRHDSKLLALHKLELKEATRSKRHEWNWTDRLKQQADHIMAAVEELRPWWPLTVRQVFYRLISSDFVNEPCWQWAGQQIDIYDRVSPQLKQLRIEKKVAWDAITDEHRTITEKVGVESPDEFIEEQRESFLQGYSRDYSQGQEYYIEVWVEKAALFHIVEPVADEFSRRVVVCRGYDSVTFLNDFRDRAEEAQLNGQTPLVLYFGDWDPSGENMPYSAMQTLEDDLGLYGVEYHRGGINPEHFPLIPADPVPIKPSDSRAKRFVKRYGTTAYELDAFHPQQPQGLVRQSLAHFTDMDELRRNKEQEDSDRQRIEELRREVLEYCDGLLQDRTEDS